MGAFGFDTTAEEAAQALSSHIRNRTALVTGVTKGGLGFETARVIALHGATELILAGRSIEKLVEAEEAIKAETPTVKIRKLVFDLGSLASIRKGVQELNSWPDLPKIHVLVNNAAIAACPFALTEDGVESQFATNHLGHFLLTALIIDKIVAAGPGARVITVSSAGHRRTDVRLDDWNFDRGDYTPWLGYGQSKTANMLFTLELAKKLEPKDIQAFSLHPGAISTNLARTIARDEMIAMGWMDKNGQLINSDTLRWKTIPQGTSTTIVAAFDPSIADRSGEYLVDCVISEPKQPYAKDPERAEKLWTLSEKLVGQKFDV